LSNLANRQTDRQTRANAFTSSFVGGNNVSKTLIVKNQTVIDCLQLSDTRRPTMHFHFLGEYSKLDEVKTMGYTHGNINAI